MLRVIDCRDATPIFAGADFVNVHISVNREFCLRRKLALSVFRHPLRLLGCETGDRVIHRGEPFRFVMGAMELR